MILHSITTDVEICEHCGGLHLAVPMESSGYTRYERGQWFAVYEGRCQNSGKVLQGLIRIDREPEVIPSYADVPPTHLVEIRDIIG